MSLTVTRSHDAAFTYEQMRAVARASMHDNTVVVPAFPARDTLSHWPGEPIGDGPPFHRCAWCDEDRAWNDLAPSYESGYHGPGFVCLTCAMHRRARP